MLPILYLILASVSKFENLLVPFDYFLIVSNLNIFIWHLGCNLHYICLIFVKFAIFKLLRLILQLIANVLHKMQICETKNFNTSC